MSTLSVESVASTRKKTKETVRAESLLPEGLREKSATLIGLLKDYYTFLNASGQPSYELNSINVSRDLDEADSIFLDKIQKEIAYAVPRTVIADRLRLYKNLIRYYRLRGSAESIQLFFRIIFNDPVEVYYPRDQLFAPSDGKWDSSFSRAVYTENPIIYVKGNGTGAYARAIIENGVIAQIPITNAGSGYDTNPENAPEITIADVSGGEGTGATAVATVGTGKVKLVFASGWDGGYGYTSATVTITDVSGGTGADATAVAHIGEGGVSVVYPTGWSGGSGYTKAIVTIADVSGGSGTGATAKAILDESGSITEIIITNAGSGYTAPIIAIDGILSSGGTEADPVDATSDLGKIASITLTNSGDGYIDPSISITGDGSGAETGLSVTTDYSTIVGVKVTAGGKNYTHTTGAYPIASVAAPSSGGVQAELGEPEVNDGAVSSVTVYDFGSNYTAAKAEIVTSGEVPAVINPLRDENGEIHEYEIIYPGAGYALAGQFIEYTQGVYLNKKGFLSDVMRLQDSYFWQKYSYVIRAGNNVSVWSDIFNKLVHPAGFIYFGELLLLIELTNLNAKMPKLQPGVAGDAERTVKILIDQYNVSVLALTETTYSTTLQIANTVDLEDQVRAEDQTPFALAYGNLTVAQADGNQGAVDPLYPYGNRTISTAINTGTSPYVVNGVTYYVEVVD